MTRNFTYSALTLRVKPSGESNREAWFLTAEEGLVRATVFGGPKSRFRSLVSPFHQGILMIYHDPVRDSRKVSDFDVQSYRIGLREMWERVMTADSIAETILSSRGGGGNWPEALELAGGVLDALASAEQAKCSEISVYFLWHWARFLGLGPELSASCTCRPRHDEVLWYSPRKEAFYCENCAGSGSQPGSDASFRVGVEAITWLQKIETIPPAAILDMEIRLEESPALEQAKNLSQAVMAGALGKKLPGWN